MFATSFLHILCCLFLTQHPFCSLIPLYSLYTLTGSWTLGVKGTVLYNCGIELGVCD